MPPLVMLQKSVVWEGTVTVFVFFKSHRLMIIRSGGEVGYANFASRAWETSFTPGVPSTSRILTRVLK